MKRILIFIFILLLMHTAIAIRISPDSIRIEFEPNFEKSYTFNTERADNIEPYIEGSLAEYVTVEKNNIAKDGTFVIKVKLPAEIETPGKNLVFVSITESGKGGGTVAGIASIRTPIDIRVPYPGIYAEIGFNVHDLNINETGNFAVTINNLGKEEIDDAKAIIGIFDNKEVLVERLFTQEKQVKVKAQESLEALFDPSKHAAGAYKAIAHVTYAGKSKDLEANFKIGTLNVKIINYTKTFFKDKIAKFDIEIESGWNSKINSIFAEVKVFNNTKEVSSFKTISIDLEPWEKRIISTFWDPEGLEEGAYDIEITLFYEGQATKIVDAVEIIAEKEKTIFKRYLTTINLLIAAVVLLILINIIVLVRKRKK